MSVNADNHPAPAPTTGAVGPISALAACSRLPRYARLLVRLARDPRVPWHLKALIFGAASYALLPWDLLPEFVPIEENGDEIVIALLVLREFIFLAPREVVAEHWAAVFGTTTRSLEELNARIERYKPQVQRQLLAVYQNITGFFTPEPLLGADEGA